MGFSDHNTRQGCISLLGGIFPAPLPRPGQSLPCILPGFSSAHSRRQATLRIYLVITLAVHVPVR